MKKYLLLFISASLAFTSCYKEDSIHAELGEPRYTIEDSSDPLDHARYVTFQNTGIYVLYDYEEVDYKWNINSSTLSSNRLVLQEDRGVLTKSMTYLDRVLFDYYSDSFAKQYFPLKILLADTVANTSIPALDDRLCASGRSYLAIGQLHVDGMPSTADELNVAKGVVNGELWGSIFYGHDLIVIPDSFFAFSEEYYGADFNAMPEKDDPATLYKLGFWSYNEASVSSSDYPAPDRAADVNDFVERITSHTAAEMEELMAKYSLLQQKYTILVNAIKENYGIDLQAIGENKPAAL